MAGHTVLGVLVLLIMLYLLAIMPRVLQRRDMAPFKGCYFAHRGLHQEKNTSPENSLLAFRQAVQRKYGIEFDVQLSKDNIPVVFHDYSLMRVCGVDQKVCELTYEELRKLRLFTSNQQIPHLTEVLEEVHGEVPLIIELKIEDTDISLCGVVAPYLDKYTGVYCVESFNPLGLLWFKKNRPEILRGQLSSNLLKEEEGGDKIRYFVLQNLLLNFMTKPDFIAFNFKYHQMLSFVLCCQLYKAPAFAWTIASQEAVEQCRETFDTFIFEGFLPHKPKLEQE